MGDKFTAETGEESLYWVRTQPTGEVFLLDGTSAQQVSLMVPGIALRAGIEFNGTYEVRPATSQDISDAFIGDLEEE